FLADNYDVLYDCPILAGNMELLHFEVDNIPYTVAVENPGATDLAGFKKDLQKVIPVATGLIGDIPYKHYTFLIMDRGMGGLEHANSMAVYARGNFYEKENKDRNKGWMNFITHEFFHLYNVKRIRPAGIWPLDYNSENYTEMLWVSEGFTVYYEYMIMNRAGLLTGDDVLNYLGNTIRTYESIPGSRYQSATESSFNTWINFFNRSSNTQNATISYYDKGCALGMLLDLAIRKETGNEKSLDDVMRKLYFRYYRELKRGFTGDEFRSECESIAGTSLDEIFDVYVSTTGNIDYNKYLGYAGLQIATVAEPVRGSYLGATTRDISGETVITSILRDSPAWIYGLSVDDVILEINNQPLKDRPLDEILKHTIPGDTLQFKVKHRYLQRDISVVTDTAKSVSYRISAVPDPDPMQQLILNDWLK
ncbi:MAG: PDZ domain-containing protein, partial [Bacteroidales bacterium]|nr:PDZ domain-containing protein [Bacteroidales bacterium]